MNAIEFDQVGKLYRLGQVGTGTLSHDLNRWWQTRILGREDPYLRVGETNDRARKGNSDFVWALRDISFNVAEGEVVGIIGKNGAGKSTLLKLLSCVTAPTTGEIRTRGRIASLLEVGTGFHQEMTGRENIFMNGTILGMTRAEISSKLDAIVEFAGVERYLDTPVKRYSSGMTVRLGFAVAAFLEPEILVVDEVLAVGDAEFQKKAIGKMQDVSRGEGRTVLFVSHNMAAVRRLCQRGIVLENGQLSFDGVVHDAISRYLENTRVQTCFEGIDGSIDYAYLRKALVRPKYGSVILNSSPIVIELDFCLIQKIPSLVVGFNIFSQYIYPLARADYNDENHLSSLAPGSYHLVFEIPPYTFSGGSYSIRFDIAAKGIRRYSSERSWLTFTVSIGNDCFGNTFSENIPLKSSIIQGKWLKSIDVL